MRSCFLLAVALLLSFSSIAQNCAIRGQAKGYEGRKLAVVALADELSEKRLLLAQCDVSDSGTFAIDFDPQVTRRVYLHIQRVEAPIYVEPGKKYEVVFPALDKAEYKRFDNTEVNLTLLGLDNDDLNLQIRKFNADFADFIAQHFYDFATQEYKGSSAYLKYLGDKKSKVDLYRSANGQDSLQQTGASNFGNLVSQFADSILHNKAATENDFLQDYKRFSIAELFLLSGMSRKLFYENYLMSIVPPLHNPAFASCFKLFAQNLLTGQKANVQSALIKAVNVDRDLVRLGEALSFESELKSSRLKQLAAICGLKEVYNNKSYDRSAIDFLLSHVASQDSLIDEVAESMLFQLSKCRMGWNMPEVVFTDEAQDKWHLSDNQGQPVYLLFFATWSPSSLKEILVLERAKEKFNGRIRFVAVCMDDDYRNYRKYIEEHMKMPIPIVYGNADPFVHEKFNLKSSPHQVMIDANSRVAADVCPPPSDAQFESFLNRIALPVNPNSQAPKTWRNH
ncbi:MAG: TlpA family protein disulfide reductase [Flavobacteriales bacterium]